MAFETKRLANKYIKRILKESSGSQLQTLATANFAGTRIHGAPRVEEALRKILLLILVLVLAYEFFESEFVAPLQAHGQVNLAGTDRQ